jgi:hypothetical protein
MMMMGSWTAPSTARSAGASARAPSRVAPRLARPLSRHGHASVPAQLGPDRVRCATGSRRPSTSRTPVRCRLREPDDDGLVDGVESRCPPRAAFQAGCGRPLAVLPRASTPAAPSTARQVGASVRAPSRVAPRLARPLSRHGHASEPAQLGPGRVRCATRSRRPSTSRTPVRCGLREPHDDGLVDGVESRVLCGRISKPVVGARLPRLAPGVHTGGTVHSQARRRQHASAPASGTAPRAKPPPCSGVRAR